MLAPFVLTSAAWAQNAAAEPEGKSGEAPAATLRTLEDMQALEAANPAVPVVMPPDFPTMDFQQYRDLKEAAPAPGEVKPGRASHRYRQPHRPWGRCTVTVSARARRLSRGSFRRTPTAPLAQTTSARSSTARSSSTARRSLVTAPPQTCSPKACLASLATPIRRYSTRGSCTDLTYNRWIVSAEAFAESATVQRQFIAVSVDSDPTHGFFIYDFNARGFIGKTACSGTTPKSAMTRTRSF